MKKIFFLSLALIITSVLTLSSCSKNDPNEIEKELEKVTPTLSIATKSYEVSGAGETIKVSIVTNQTLSVSVPATIGWIHAQVTDSKTVTLTIDVNEETEQRTADITINGGSLSETIKITQSGSFILSLNISETTVSHEGGTVAVQTKSNLEYEVVMPDIDWIKRDQSRGVLTTSFSFEISKNTSGEIREAVILFKDINGGMEKSLKIIQDANPILAVSEELFEFDEVGGTFSIDVTTNVDYTIEIDDDWIKLVDSSRGVTTETLTFEVSAMNESGEDREGAVILYNEKNGIAQRLLIKQSFASVKFEDSYFEAYMLDNFDSNKDGRLSIEEAKAVKKIESGYNFASVKSLSGIEYCINLEEIAIYGANLTELDVSKNTALKNLLYRGSSLTSLIIGENKNLQYICCDINRLTELDVNGCPSLEVLDCSGNMLTSLDVSGCKNLKRLSCDRNELTNLKFDCRATLGSLNCEYNQLKTLDVSGYTALGYLRCSYNQLFSLNVNGCLALETLYCDDNQLPNLEVSGCTALESLYCSKNKISFLKVNGCISLVDISCNDNNINTLRVNSCVSLENLACARNRLTSLDFTNCPSLQYLYCSDNKLETLNVTNNSNLIYLYCENNQLTSLDVNNKKLLERLGCENNQITYLDISKSTNCELLRCRNNPLKTLILSAGQRFIVLEYPYNITPQYK